MYKHLIHLLLNSRFPCFNRIGILTMPKCKKMKIIITEVHISGTFSDKIIIIGYDWLIGCRWIEDWNTLATILGNLHYFPAGRFNLWDGVLAAFSASDLEVLGSSATTASLIPEVSVFDVQLRASLSLFSPMAHSAKWTGNRMGVEREPTIVVAKPRAINYLNYLDRLL